MSIIAAENEKINPEGIEDCLSSILGELECVD